MEMNEAIETIQVQKAYIVSMVKQLELMDHTLREHTLARETLEGIQGKPEGSEMLIPIGGATKAFGSLKQVSKVIVNIGSGVEMEMPIKDAIEHHDSLIKNLGEERGKLQEKLRELEKSTQLLSSAVEKAYAQQMQQQQQMQEPGQNLMS